MHSLKIGGANNAGFKHMEADLKDRHSGPGGGGYFGVKGIGMTVGNPRKLP